MLEFVLGAASMLHSLRLRRGLFVWTCVVLLTGSGDSLAFERFFGLTQDMHGCGLLGFSYIGNRWAWFVALGDFCAEAIYT